MAWYMFVSLVLNAVNYEEEVEEEEEEEYHSKVHKISIK